MPIQAGRNDEDRPVGRHVSCRNVARELQPADSVLHRSVSHRSVSCLRRGPIEGCTTYLFAPLVSYSNTRLVASKDSSRSEVGTNSPFFRTCCSSSMLSA